MTYYVEMWVWTDGEYIPKSTAEMTMVEAKKVYDSIEPTDDSPQVSLYEITEEENKRIALKYLTRGGVKEE